MFTNEQAPVLPGQKNSASLADVIDAGDTLYKGGRYKISRYSPQFIRSVKNDWQLPFLRKSKEPCLIFFQIDRSDPENSLAENTVLFQHFQNGIGDPVPGCPLSASDTQCQDPGNQIEGICRVFRQMPEGENDIRPGAVRNLHSPFPVTIQTFLQRAV